MTTDYLNAEVLTSLVEKMMPEVIAIRRRLHSHPEISGNEENTAAHIASILEGANIPVQRHIGGHGLLAMIESDHGPDWTALRADMDALPIDDHKPCDYASKTTGVSHACGHDAHAAMLAGAALILNELRGQLPCHVACVFQPAEETSEGAAAMLADDVFADMHPKRMLALHVYPYLPAGSIGIRAGVTCAAADMFEVEICGRGGHAARPHECVDAILIASHIIAALHPRLFPAGRGNKRGCCRNAGG